MTSKANKDILKKTQDKPRAKTIKLKDIKKQNDLYNKLTSFTLDEETNLQIKYNEKFSGTKIQEVLMETYAALIYAEENKIDFFKEESQLLQYVYFLIARKFTSLESEIPADFPSQVSIMNQIIEIGLFERIFDEIFNPVEVEKVIYRLEQLIATVAQIGEITKKELSQLGSDLDNKDLMTSLDESLILKNDAND